jgi:hypothetical protein
VYIKDPSRLPPQSLQTLISTRPIDSTRLLNFAETAASSMDPNARSLAVSEIARVAGIPCVTTDDRTAEQSLVESVKSLRGSASGVSGVTHPSFTSPDANGNADTTSSTSQPIHGSLCLSSFTVR